MLPNIRAAWGHYFLPECYADCMAERECGSEMNDCVKSISNATGEPQACDLSQADEATSACGYVILRRVHDA